MKSFYFFIIVLACCQVNLHAQQQPGASTPLRFKNTVRAGLKAGDIHVYTLYLKAGQFAGIRIRQESIGIAFSVFAPNDSLMENADLNAIYQTEMVAISAKQTGNYRVEVSWDYGRPQTGLYSIVWDKTETAAVTPAAQAAQLFQSWYDNDGPGAAVAVIKDGKVIFKSVKGRANLEHGIPLTASSAFELASVSKQFTAYAIALLAEKQLLSLDDSIRKFLPELPDIGKTITVRQLVHHTSGLRNWDDMMNASGNRTEDIITMDMIMKMASTVKYLNFNPGEAFAYSNTGYNLLAKIVERVTGQSFAGWMKENIFRPLEMNHTVIKEDILQVIANKVYSYKAGKEGFTALPDNISAPGSTSVYSSIDDLIKWVNNFESGQAGGKNVLALVNTRGRLNNGKQLEYAFGNFTGDYKGTAKTEHLGLWSGFRTAIARYPEEKLAVIYLANDANDATYQHAWTIADLFLSHIKRTSPKAGPLPDLKDFLVKTAPIIPAKDTADLHENEGIYFATELNTAFTLKVIDSTLTIVLPRRENIYLARESADKFASSFPDFKRRVEFRRDPAGKLTSFILTSGGRGIVFYKLK